MKRILFLILICTFFSWGICQPDSYVDSLKSVLKNTTSDTVKARIYIELAEEIVDEKEWTSYNEKAYKLAKEKLLTAEGKEREFYLKIKANAVGNKGYLSDEHGKIQEAIQYYFESLKLYDQANDMQGKAVIYGNLGVIYSNQKDFKEALDYFNKSIAIKEKHMPNELTLSYNNLGVVYEGLGDSTKALEYYQRALYSGLRNKENSNVAIAFGNIGSWYFNHKEYRKAIPYHKGAIRYSDLAGDESAKAWTMANLSNAYLNLQMMDSAKYYAEEALVLANQFQYPRLIINVYEKLYNINFVEKNFEDALYYRNLLISMKDSTQSIAAQKEAIKQKLEYDYELEEEKAKLKREEEKKRTKERQTYFLIGIGLLLVFAIILFSRLRITRKQKKIIEEQKHVVDEKNAEIMDSIAYAKRIQSAILPPDKLIKEHLPNSFVLYKPKDIVAGDFYWLESFAKASAPEGILIAAADCTGHGVPGAMVSVVCNNGLNRSVREFGLTDPGKILDKTRELVIEEFEKSDSSSSYADTYAEASMSKEAFTDEIKDGMDIALVALVQSELESVPIAIGSEAHHSHTTHSLSYSAAHNPLWIIRKGSNEIEEIKAKFSAETSERINVFSNDGYTFIEVKADKQPIGKFIDPKPYTTHEIELNSGDTIYIFSDGYADQFGGESGKKLKSKNFKRKLIEIQHLEMGEQKLELDRFFEEWRGNHEQIDDVCVIGVRI